jgi:hypothetical protein
MGEKVKMANPFESFSDVMESLIMSDNSARAEILLSILSERDRQISVEGYTPAHDDEHTEGQLTSLAAAYALSSRGDTSALLDSFIHTYIPDGWPFKPKDHIRDLTRAGALILAELERRLRMEKPTP